MAAAPNVMIGLIVYPTRIHYVMECELAEVINTENMYAIVGKIVDTKAEESILDEKDKVEVEKLQALIFDQFKHGYYVSGDKAGKAWNAGKDLMK